jgi:DnaJ-class molecular chaperone
MKQEPTYWRRGDPPRPVFGTTTRCQRCNGRGHYFAGTPRHLVDPCLACGGSGFVDRTPGAVP